MHIFSYSASVNMGVGRMTYTIWFAAGKIFFKTLINDLSEFNESDYSMA